MTAPLRIFVCGPYWSDDPGTRFRNVLRATEIGGEVFRAGHFPFVPHLYHYLSCSFDDLTEEDFLAADRAFLVRCDAVLYYAGSPNADREVDLAGRAGLPVFHDVGALPRVGSTTTRTARGAT